MRWLFQCAALLVLLGACAQPEPKRLVGGPGWVRLPDGTLYFHPSFWGPERPANPTVVQTVRYLQPQQVHPIPVLATPESSRSVIVKTVPAVPEPQARPVAQKASPAPVAQKPAPPAPVVQRSTPAPATITRARPAPPQPKTYSTARTATEPVSKAPKASRTLPKIETAAILPNSPLTAPTPPRRPVSATPKPVTRPTVMAGQVTQASEPVEIASLTPEPSIPRVPSTLTAVSVPDSQPQLSSEAVSGKEMESHLSPGKIPASIGIANIRSGEAAQIDVGGLEQSTAGEAGTIPWSEAIALLQAGEIEGYVGIGGQDILVTLCSGRGVVTSQPKEGAILEVSVPEIICGRQAALQGN